MAIRNCPIAVDTNIFHRRGRECLSVDEHRAGGHALTGQAELATQVVVGDPTAAATALGAPHGGGHAEDRQLGCRRRGHNDAVGRLEANRVVVDVAALGEQGRDGFRGVMGTAAADADEDVGLHLFGHRHPLFDRFDRRMGRDARIDAHIAGAQCLLHARHDVAGAQNGGPAGNHRAAGAQRVDGGRQRGNRGFGSK